MGRREGSQQRVHDALVHYQVTICLVTDRRQLSPDARTTRDEVLALARWLEEAVAAGIDLIQLRERDLPATLLAELARAVRETAAGSATRVVVNDRADVAMACGCDGVHLRGDGPPVERVRDLVGRPVFVARPGFEGREDPAWIVGRSVHSVEEARLHSSADYLLFGAVFDSGEKRGLGLGALRAAATAYSGVIAIGGITVTRVPECIASGATGVAAIRLFLPPGRADGALGLLDASNQLHRAFDAAAMRHLQ